LSNGSPIVSVKFWNFRSVAESIELSLAEKLILLVGQNNSGKTSIMRFLALLLNKSWGSLDEKHDVPVGKSLPVHFQIQLSRSSFDTRLGQRKFLRQMVASNSAGGVYLKGHFTSQQLIWDFDEKFFELVPKSYFVQNNFHQDHGSSSSSAQDNLNQFKNSMQSWLDDLIGTVYVPSLRFIATQAVPHFAQRTFPGSTVAFSIIDAISQLSSMDGSVDQRAKAKDQLAEVEKFVAHCLEEKNVSLSVTHSKNDLFVTIDGKEIPIGNLGSGVEQLILLGMASFAFPGKTVLIDEPELHFHPRTQKLLIRYLLEKSDSRFVIATHSAAIIDAADGCILHVEETQGNTSTKLVKSNSERFEAIRNLGHSPSELVQSNFVIWVEGPSDRIYLLKWISLLNTELVEGVDFTILFYGGSVLASHEFDDEARDLVKALSVCRQFAVYMDSDKAKTTSGLKTRVQRVDSEVIKAGGMSWISNGREIENYVPFEIVNELSSKLSGIAPSKNKFSKIVVSKKCDKVRFAKEVIERWTTEWPLDLKPKIEELVSRIIRAR
jgi:AAA15 family ATPase/GTPase